MPVSYGAVLFSQPISSAKSASADSNQSGKIFSTDIWGDVVSDVDTSSSEKAEDENDDDPFGAILEMFQNRK